MRKAWHRKLWGVNFTGNNPREAPMLIGGNWHIGARPGHIGEPSRALLFQTRAEAREWCANKMHEWRRIGGAVGYWKVRAVRVEEIVRSCK